MDTLMQSFWQWHLRESPELAILANLDLYKDRFESQSFEADELRIKAVKKFIKELEDINYEHLYPDYKFYYDLLKEQFSIFLKGSKWRYHVTCNAINFLENIVTDTTSFLLPMTTFESIKDFEMFLKRLECIPQLLDEKTEKCKKAIENNTTLYCSSINRFVDQLKAYIMQSAEETPLFSPFKTKLQSK